MAEVTDTCEDEADRKRAYEGGEDELARRELAEARETGDGFVEDGQTTRECDDGAALRGEPIARGIETGCVGETERERASNLSRQAIGDHCGEEGAERGSEASEQGAIEPSEGRHDDGAGDGEREVGDEQGYPDQPSDGTVPFEQDAGGVDVEEGLEEIAP